MRHNVKRRFATGGKYTFHHFTVSKVFEAHCRFLNDVLSSFRNLLKRLTVKEWKEKQNPKNSRWILSMNALVVGIVIQMFRNNFFRIILDLCVFYHGLTESTIYYLLWDDAFNNLHLPHQNRTSSGNVDTWAKKQHEFIT